MKILMAYPNLPMMLSPPLSVAYFTDICDREEVEFQLFETSTYDDASFADAQTRKEQLGAGRAMVDYEDAFEMLKPTQEMIPDFVKKVNEYKPDLILLSIVEDTYFDGMKMLESVNHLNIPHIVGGVFPINAPDLVIANPLVKIMCRYEGEYVVRDVIRKMKGGESIQDVKGLWIKNEDGTILKNPPQPLVDLSEYYTNYRLFSEKRFYRPIGGKVRRTLQLETYRGCPYSCTYCNSPTTRDMDKKFVRRDSLDSVKRKIERTIKDNNPQFWFILDDSFTARPKRELFPLLDILKDAGIPWWCNTRFDDIDEEILAAMKEGHCERIQFGLESGNEYYRINYLKRNVRQEVYYKKAEIMNASGIPYGMNVIIGLPLETRSMVMDTARLCKDIGGYDGLGVSLFVPYHGTGLRKVALEHGFIKEDQIGSNGGFQGLPFMRMPKPYLQLDEMQDLTEKFKYYAYFKESMWPEIDAAKDLSKYEKIYQEEFFSSPIAQYGDEHVASRKKSKWACEADEYMDFRQYAC